MSDNLVSSKKKRTVTIVRKVKPSTKKEVFISRNLEAQNGDSTDKLLHPFRGNAFLQTDNLKYGLLMDSDPSLAQTPQDKLQQQDVSLSQTSDSFPLLAEDILNMSRNSLSQTGPSTITRAQLRTLSRWKRRIKEWKSVKAELSNKLEMDEESLLISKTNGYLEKIQSIDAAQASIPLHESCGLNYWEISLRGGGPKYVPIGNIFSGLYCPVTFEPPKPRKKLRSRVPWMSNLSRGSQMSGSQRDSLDETTNDAISIATTQAPESRPQTSNVPIIVLHSHADLLFSTSSPTKTCYRTVKMENKSNVALHFNVTASTHVDAILFSCQPKRGFVPPNQSIDLEVMFHPAKAGCWYGSLNFAVSPSSVIRVNFTEMGKVQDVILHPTTITLRGIAMEESFDIHCIADLNSRFTMDTHGDAVTGEISKLMSSISTPRYVNRMRAVQQVKFENANEDAGLWYSEAMYDKFWKIKEEVSNNRQVEEFSEDDLFNDSWDGHVDNLICEVQHKVEGGDSSLSAILLQLQLMRNESLIQPSLLEALTTTKRSSDVTAVLFNAMMDGFDVYTVAKTSALNVIKAAATKLPAKGSKLTKSNSILPEPVDGEKIASLSDLAGQRGKSVIQLWSDDILVAAPQLNNEGPYYQTLYNSLKPSIETALTSDFEKVFRSLSVGAESRINLARNVMINPADMKQKVVALHYDFGNKMRVEDEEQVYSDILLASRNDPKLTIVTASFSASSMSMKSFARSAKQRFGKAFSVNFCDSIPKLMADVQRRRGTNDLLEKKRVSHLIIMESLSSNDIMPKPVKEVPVHEDDDCERISIGRCLPPVKIDHVVVNVDMGKGSSISVDCNVNIRKCLNQVADIVVVDSSADANSSRPLWLDLNVPIYGGMGFQSEIEAMRVFLSASEKKSIAIIGGSDFRATIPVLMKAITTMRSVVVVGAISHPFLVNAHRRALFIRNHPSYDATGEPMAKFMNMLALYFGCNLILPEDLVGCASRLSGSNGVGNEAKHSSFDVDDEIVTLSEPYLLEAENLFYPYEIGPNTIGKIEEMINSSVLVWIHGVPALVECNQFQQSTQTIFSAAITRSLNQQCISVFSGEDTSSWCSKISSENGMDVFDEGNTALLKPMPAKLYIVPRPCFMRQLTTRRELLMTSRLQLTASGVNLGEYVALQSMPEEDAQQEEEEKEV